MVREEVLRALEEQKGELLSGAALAKRLQVSRTAVWKAIACLREEGFPISSNSSGYCLSVDSDLLSEAGIGCYLKTRYLGRSMEIHRQVDSTNTLLKQKTHMQNGFLLLAEKQTAGRGRLGRSFHSPSGSGVYFSVLLHPSLPIDRLHFLTIAAAVAASQAVEDEAGTAPQIKWVNDLLLQEKKICGILTEAALEAETGIISYAIVGIGINIRPPENGWPEDLARIVCSVSEVSKQKISRNRLIAQTLNHLEPYCDDILSGQTGPLLDAYQSRLAFLNRQAWAENGQTRFLVTIKGIDLNGHLIIEYPDGKKGTLHAGEISIRPLHGA